MLQGPQARHRDTSIEGAPIDLRPSDLSPGDAAMLAGHIDVVSRRIDAPASRDSAIWRNVRHRPAAGADELGLAVGGLI